MSQILRFPNTERIISVSIHKHSTMSPWLEVPSRKEMSHFHLNTDRKYHTHQLQCEQILLMDLKQILERHQFTQPRKVRRSTSDGPKYWANTTQFSKPSYISPSKHVTGSTKKQTQPFKGYITTGFQS